MPPGAGFHRREVSTEMPGPVGAALWQTDQPGARSGVVIAGEVLSEGQAHDLGLELVRAAEILRRERQAVEA
ncbi:MAG: hypothetical protein CMJ44_07695 [Pimelobacter sp.]|nr:hypothetical protein [Pimelobacter sp.]